MSARVSKLDIWNTFATASGKFKPYRRADLVDALSRSVVTYWIDNNYLTKGRTPKLGSVLVLTELGKKHLIETTAVWLKKRPSQLTDCPFPHPSFTE